MEKDKWPGFVHSIYPDVVFFQLFQGLSELSRDKRDQGPSDIAPLLLASGRSSDSGLRGFSMNIRTLCMPLAVVALLALAGCSTPTVVTLQNGTQYLTEDMPDTTAEDGFVEFKDISGATVKVKADDVATIRKEK
jgi:hypothetical protein